MTPTLSLVLPIYNEEANIPQLYNRLCEVINDLGESTELILVDDGSHDRSLEMIRALREKDDRVCYISFSRNFGHQTAVTAGLNFTQGDAVVVMDADLQDPPELLPRMLEVWRSGYEVVYAKRTFRKKEGWLKQFLAYQYYRVVRHLADVDIPTDTGDFCLMDRAVVTALNKMPERNRYIRGLRAWVGFRQTEVLFEREARFAGEVKYTFLKSLGLAIDGIISMSRIPLRFATYLGIITAIFSLLMVILTMYWRIIDPNVHLVGYALITSSIFFIGAVQLFSLGILGEYIGRIYDEVKSRPAYLIKEIGGVCYPSNH